MTCAIGATVAQRERDEEAEPITCATLRAWRLGAESEKEMKDEKKMIQCCQMGQHAHYDEIVFFNLPNQIRVVIDIDTSYRKQSSAFVSAWNPVQKQWNEIYSIPWPLLKSKPEMTWDSVIPHEHFKADRDALVEAATKIIYSGTV